MNFIYGVPLFRQNESRLLKATVGGWQVSGIDTMESGLPIIEGISEQELSATSSS